MKARIGNVEFDVESKEDLDLLLKAKMIEPQVVDGLTEQEIKSVVEVKKPYQLRLERAVKLAHAKNINYSRAFVKVFDGNRLGGADIKKMNKIAKELGFNPKDVKGKRKRSSSRVGFKYWTPYEDSVVKHSNSAGEAHNQLKGKRTIQAIYVRRNKLGVTK
jgi:hypothetical protein